MWGLSEKRYEATFWGWGSNVLYLDRGGLHKYTHLSKPHKWCIYKCAFIIYKNCNDTHTKLFRNEVYQIPITYFKIIFLKRWIDGQ